MVVERGSLSRKMSPLPLSFLQKSMQEFGDRLNAQSISRNDLTDSRLATFYERLRRTIFSQVMTGTHQEPLYSRNQELAAKKEPSKHTKIIESFQAQMEELIDESCHFSSLTAEEPIDTVTIRSGKTKGIFCQ